MKTNLLGSSGQAWTEVCLGSMTWGIQNSEAEAHEQLDYAIKERGVNCALITTISSLITSHPQQVF